MPLREKGSHTWDLVVRYHRCPQCGVIIESRTDYVYQLGHYVKQVDCQRCGHKFTDTRRVKPENSTED